jgi:uncharacterized protein (DUF58 family)
MKKFRIPIFFTKQFFVYGVAVVLLFSFSFSFPFLFKIAQIGLLAMLIAFLADLFLLKNNIINISARRFIPAYLGLNDDVEITLRIDTDLRGNAEAVLIDELPEQFQKRDFSLSLTLENGVNEAHYKIHPKKRGIYNFGCLNIYITGPLGLISWKVILDISESAKVYPSVQQMHEHELLAFTRVSFHTGFRKYGRIGKSYEFEQISPFVEGDDYRNINWKASGKMRELMVNQYQDERSQNMYCIISKGRAMKMAFNNMSYLDYAINSTLAISNVGLKKYDRVGLISFSNKIGSALRAENRPGQIQKILESLYAEKERDLEPDFELLYRSLERIVKNRSLLLLFANFENISMLFRVMPILKKISKKHLLVMVLFKDEELEEAIIPNPGTIDEIYASTLAEQHQSEKLEVAHILKSQGIQTIVSSPKDLSLNVINKYLELKSRGMV